jgi:hypothetical protein
MNNQKSVVSVVDTLKSFVKSKEKVEVRFPKDEYSFGKKVRNIEPVRNRRVFLSDDGNSIMVKFNRRLWSVVSIDTSEDKAPIVTEVSVVAEDTVSTDSVETSQTTVETPQEESEEEPQEESEEESVRMAS